jgi:hypothetical protein
MKYIYYIDGEKFKTYNYKEIPQYYISSPDENTPACQNLETGYKLWYQIDKVLHRLTGPARICSDVFKEFYLNGKKYENVNDWLKDHPNPDLYFDTLGMNEADRILWFLQN